MKTFTIVMAVISLILSVPAIQMGRRKNNKKLLIEGLIALGLGAYLLIAGYSS